MTAPILVTGGAGFLGSWLVRRLVERGAQVRVLDLPKARWSGLPEERVVRVLADIRDRAAVARAARACQAVVHLAGVPQLWVQPRGLFHQVNYLGAVNVLDAAVAAGCQRILHVSSATIWPLHDEPICRWRDALGCYGRSKWRAERHALRWARRGAPVVVVSPTAVIGPGDVSRTAPTQWLLDVCHGRRAYVDATLGLVDVRDAVEGMIRLLEGGASGGRYLLGGAALSVLELYERMAMLTKQPMVGRRLPHWLALLFGIALEWWADVISGKTPAACVAGVRLARRPLPADLGADLRRLGVTPRPLDQTLTDAVAWYRAEGWFKR